MSRREQSGIHERKVCRLQGKRRYSSPYFAGLAAKELHRDLNAQGLLAADTYTYRCTRCGSWHLTRHAVYRGTPQQLALEAAPEELQRWAMPQ